MALPPPLVLLLVDQKRAAGLVETLPAQISHVLVAPLAPQALALQLACLHRACASPASSGPDVQTLLARLQSSPDLPVHGMMIGLRRIEAINATFGNAVGDAALAVAQARLERQVTQRLSSRALCLRLSGGSFLIADTHAENRLAWQIESEHLLKQLSEPVEVLGQVLRLTARASLALAKPDEGPVSLLDRLSAGLAQARTSPADPVRWTDRTADHAPESGYRLEQDLVHAIERGEIRVLFQPQFEIASGTISGAEALARWQHPRHGEIGAGTLFALADKADLTRQLSRHIRAVALDNAARWTESLAGLRLSVNLTAEDLSESGFARRELAMIAASGFDPARLTLEITESALVPDLKRAAARFADLRAAGLRIAVDDFGTGYSNLLYLKALPLDYLKLDHAMTRDLGSADTDRIIVRSVIALARALDLKVIAEGIEDELQLAVLAEEGCDYYQGFLKGGAMEAEAFAAFASLALA
ncbi:EAL domain-containing protein [Blastomonas sp.]|uniref:EAL domain-containing protein n=1 Tax=Blastomonas sp. TaxID=1909299 RepID=UPI003593F2DA